MALRLARILACLGIAIVTAAAQALLSGPLLDAALRGDLQQVRSLLADGADPNSRDSDGVTPLMQTVNIVTDHKGVAELLLQKGADPNAQDSSGRTALILAMQGSASEYKVIGANETMARLLVEHGARVNTQDNNGWSPLLMLLDQWADQPELIHFLLDRGADVNARTKDGKTGLMIAANVGKEDRVALLLSRGVNANARDVHGRTALMEAASGRLDNSPAIMK